jgi:hypothetical protein
MSRSRRHTPISAVTGCESNKLFKKQEHRRERSKVKMLLHVGFEDWQLPHPKRYGNEWASPRDGKQYFGDIVRPSVVHAWINNPLGYCWTRKEVEDIYNKGMRK